MSDSSATYNPYLIEGSKYYINVMKERSFSHYDEDDYISPYYGAENVGRIYCFDTETKVLSEYDPELLVYSEIMDMLDTDIESVIAAIHEHLEVSGNVIPYSDLFSVVQEIIQIGERHGNISLFGDFEVKELRYTLSKYVFLENAVLFKDHLLAIFGSAKYEDVIHSLTYQELYESIHLEFQWILNEECFFLVILSTSETSTTISLQFIRSFFSGVLTIDVAVYKTAQSYSDI